MIDDLKVFNCSSNVVGGAVQNAVNFINQIYINNAQYQWFFILNQAVYLQVKHLIPNNQFSIFPSPAKSLLARIKIKKLVNNLNPSLVYTSAGPSYISFNCVHIMGCSNPYVLGPSEASMQVLGGLYSQFMRRLHSLYQLFYFKKSDYWIVQTETSFKQLVAKGFPSKKIFVVYNSVSPDFLELNSNFENLSDKSEIAVLVPSAFYPHKNLSIIPELLKKLNTSGVKKFYFHLTVDHSIYDSLIKTSGFCEVSQYLKNIGPYKHKDAVNIYSSHDVIFLPSLLEVFSTSYIESIALKKPLVLPSFDFTHGICANYPLYYDSNSVDDCVESFYQIDNYYKLSDKYNAISDELVSKYGSQNERFTKISNILSNLK